MAVLLGALAYSSSLRAPFQFDDIIFVRYNPALRALWPPQRWILSHHQETRPLANFTFALNYAWTGRDPWSYHVVNVGLHLGCVVLLFVFVRRTLRGLAPPWPSWADAVAASAALLLSVHTAQSESVIYVQGRPGLLATFFGLATLVTVAGAAPSSGGTSIRLPRRVGALAALWTLLALLSKESAAVVPALVLLYDATLLARWRLRELGPRIVTLHLPQWGTLLVLPLMLATLSNPHEGVFGFGVVDSLRFYLTQPLVLLFYLRLYLWPAGLAIEHGFTLAEPNDVRVWLALAGMVALLATAVWALRRAPWAGFCAAWWLLAVAPTSLVPGKEFAAERYLTFASPAFAALAASVLAVGARSLSGPARPARVEILLVPAALLGLLLAWHTLGRGHTWLSASGLWRQAAQLRPGNRRIHYQLSWHLWQEQHLEEAERELRRLLAFDPGDVRSRNLLASVQMDLGQNDSALVNAALAAESAPLIPEFQVNHAAALLKLGRRSEGMAACERALAVDPNDAVALYYHAQCRAALGDTAQAVADGWTLEHRRPDTGYGPYVLGSIDLATRRDSSAAHWLELAVRRDPQLTEAMRLLPLAWYWLGRDAEALRGWQRYLAASSTARVDYAMLYYMGLTLDRLGRYREAAATLRQVTRMRPELGPAWIELAHALTAPGDPAERDTGAARAALTEGERLAEPDSAVWVRIAEVRAALAATSQGRTPD
jgi:tetratricopeptide (TPR) repeat protein